MISLRRRLILTYALFISISLAVLTLVINQFTGMIFTSLVKDNIAERNTEIVRAVGDQYDPMSRSFDPIVIEAIGMYFVHDGYIVTVEDEKGGLVWDARACDMEQCTRVLNTITERMEGNFGLKGNWQSQKFPVIFNGSQAGSVTIETYGPFFFSEAETKFLSSLNRLLLIADAVFILLSVGISILLSGAIAKPVVKAAEAARMIAKIHVKGNENRKIFINLNERYKTKELHELSRSINELAEELDESERRQKQLGSDIAHELRTPLTCLQGNIEAMIDGVWKPDREHLESCHEEILRLTRLVQDLHTLTNFEWERAALNKTDFDLSQLLRAAAEQFDQAAAGKGISIRLNLIESPINADYDRLKQVFINLLSNAVQYTDSGSITVGIEKAEVNWKITISDTGIGIPEEDLPRIFERLYRSDKSRTRSTGGAGIGLSVARAITAAHFGSISATSENGKGSVFTVIIPAA